MIVLKTARELEIMRQAGRIAARALQGVGNAVEPGVSTAELDRIARKIIEGEGAIPTFKGYDGFPASICASVNNEVIHGIPSHHRVLKAGDIISIDVGATFEGYVGDTAATFAAGEISPDAKRLMDATRDALMQGIEAARAGGRLGDIGSAVQRHVEACGYSVVRQFVGHGVGASMHEAPEVPNYGVPGRGLRLMPGMTIAIEPMVNAGGGEVSILNDGWTVVSKDGSLSAHFEHSVAITAEGPKLLTLP